MTTLVLTTSQPTSQQRTTLELQAGYGDDGQTATVQIIGAVDDAQSSLTPGQVLYSE